jgi:hypothetical protein
MVAGMEAILVVENVLRDGIAGVGDDVCVESISGLEDEEGQRG